MFNVAVYRRSPVSVAAAAIFMASQASDDKKSQKGIVLLTYLLSTGQRVDVIVPAVCTSVCLFLRLSHLSVCLFVCLGLYSVCMSLSSSLSLVSQSGCFSICLSACICLSVCLSVCPLVSLSIRLHTCMHVSTFISS